MSRARPTETTVGQVTAPAAESSPFDGLRPAWETARPHLIWMANGCASLFAVVIDFGLRHRLLIFRASHRVMWWTALAIMFVVGQALLGGLDASALTNEAHTYFAVGLGLCVIVLIFAAERRLRVASFLLGTSHGAMALMAWLVTQG